MTLKNNRAPVLCHYKLCASFHRLMWVRTGVTVQKSLNWVLTSVTLIFDSTLLSRLVIGESNSTSVHNNLTFDLDLLDGHHFSQWQWLPRKFHDDTMTGTVWKRCDRWMDRTIPRAAWSQLKTIGYLFYATSSFVHYFIAIWEFKLEIQSGNAQFGSKSLIFWHVWCRNLKDDLEKQ